MLIKITNVTPYHGYNGPIVFFGHLLEDNTIFYDGIVWQINRVPYVTDAEAYMMSSYREDMMVVYEAA